jgi:hypothetical protein
VICDLNRSLFEKTLRVFYPTPGAAVATYVDHTLNMRHFDEQSTFNLSPLAHRNLPHTSRLPGGATTQFKLPSAPAQFNKQQQVNFTINGRRTTDTFNRPYAS